MTPELCRQLYKALEYSHFILDQLSEKAHAAGDRDYLVRILQPGNSIEKAMHDYQRYLAGLPEKHRVFWEIDALDAETPREAAQEAWRAMRRLDSQANVFTILSNDGTLTTIDLGDV